MRENYVIAQFIPSNGGCPHSFSNRYTFSPQERLAEDYFGVSASSEATEIPTDSGKLSFIFSRNIRGTNYPLKALVQIDQNDEILRVTLHSNQLRGAAALNGFYQRYFISNPSLALRNTSTDETTHLKLFEGNFGGGLGFVSPWQREFIKTLAGGGVFFL